MAREGREKPSIRPIHPSETIAAPFAALTSATSRPLFRRSLNVERVLRDRKMAVLN